MKGEKKQKIKEFIYKTLFKNFFMLSLKKFGIGKDLVVL